MNSVDPKAAQRAFQEGHTIPQTKVCYKYTSHVATHLPYVLPVDRPVAQLRKSQTGPERKAH